MADKEKKSTMKRFTTNDQANYYLGIKSITINGKNAYELKGKFLDDLHNNAFSGTNGEDAVEHIEYFLKIVDPIDLPNDSELKEEALRNKAIMEGLIDEDSESNNEGWKSWDDFEIKNGNRYEIEYEKDQEDDERCELFNDTTQGWPVCTVRRFEMIKYSFEQDEEYVVVKEDEYEDLTSTSEDACRAYQEIFRMMDEGWMVTRAE
ncbi:hypothetical protein Tco_0941765 [Tanacetum coccineum]|uniref:Uncharacterized protein n=1 Tax=Tanacetum coccineum TaxID=301880 RepID=A0ABQ5DRU8_9ASTR